LRCLYSFTSSSHRICKFLACQTMPDPTRTRQTQRAALTTPALPKPT
jgi:hypothetical protein